MAFAGAFWADSLVDSMSWLTVGAQFIRLQDSDFSEAANGVVLGAAVAAQVELDPDINAGMLNIAARKAKGKFHPYIGVGVGVARTNIDAEVAVNVNVNGQNLLLAGGANDSDTNVALQVFAGVDYDVSDKIYVGGNVRYFRTEPTPFGAEVEFENVAGMVTVGYKF